MKSLVCIAALVLMSCMLLQISCKKELYCENCRGNKPPIANAGNDTSITLPSDSILLDGSSSSDPDDGIASYKWVKVDGPVFFNISGASHVSTTVNQLVEAVYQFELTVTDKGGLSDKDTMQVTVSAEGTTNRPPVANAGNDTILILPANSSTLDGSKSSDPDNNITGYQWTKISGPGVFNISNINNAQTQVVDLAEGVYEFELKVTDAGGLFSKDTIQITVNVLPPSGIICDPGPTHTRRNTFRRQKRNSCRRSGE